ncbi:MAG: DUF4129 domain-containing protein, partial [Acidimicrobiales bacterium]
ATWVLAAAGIHRRRSETHREFAHRTRQTGLLNDAAVDSFDRLAGRMDRVLFSRGGADGADRSAADAESAAIKASARRRVAWWQRLLLVLDPRDLLSTG